MDKIISAIWWVDGKVVAIGRFACDKIDAFFGGVDAFLVDWYKFTTPWDEWMPVINWVYGGYLVVQAGVYFYTGIVTNSPGYVDAGFGFLLAGFWFYLSCKSMSGWKQSRKLTGDLFREYEKVVAFIDDLKDRVDQVEASESEPDKRVPG